MSKIIIDTRDIKCTLLQELSPHLDSTVVIHDIAQAVIVCGDEMPDHPFEFERVEAILDRWGIGIVIDLTSTGPRDGLIIQLIAAVRGPKASSVPDSKSDVVGVRPAK